MKRLLLSVIFALGFHAIILSTDFSWLRLAPSPTPAAKSLLITLSAVKLQKHKAHAAVPNKASEKQLEPRFNQKPWKNPAGMPTPARVDHTVQLQKTLPGR